MFSEDVASRRAKKTVMERKRSDLSSHSFSGQVFCSEKRGKLWWRVWHFFEANASRI